MPYCCSFYRYSLLYSLFFCGLILKEAQFAVFEKIGFVAKVFHERNVVRDEKQRNASFFHKIIEQFDDILLRFRVEH